MRAVKFLLITVVGTLLISAGAFAKDNNSGKFDLTQTAKVGSTVLQPGHYKAEWTGPENALKVSILEHGKTVATARGQLEPLSQPAPYNSVTMQNAQQNSRIEEIQFSNHKDALKLIGS